MLFQRGALYDFMNVEENIMFPLTMFTEKSDEEKIYRVNDCLKRVNLENCNNLKNQRIKWRNDKKSFHCKSNCYESKIFIM